MTIDFSSPTSRLREKLVQALAAALESLSTPRDRANILDWLERCRDILAEDASTASKAMRLYEIINSRAMLEIALNSVVASAKSYARSDLPLPVKAALPLTALAAPFVGAQGAGVAAFGTAIGAPVLLLIFLGCAGLTSVIETFAGRTTTSSYLETVATFLARDDVLTVIREAIQRGEQGAPQEPRRAETPTEEQALRAFLLSMNPYDFEAHVMSFFRAAGLIAFVTRKSGDRGVDGVARHPSGPIVVQCKRYDVDNPVGRPAIQQFWGAVEEHRAWQGYIVTTSRFTTEAAESAAAAQNITLVDMQGLVGWHSDGPPL